LIVPEANAGEAAVVEGIEVIGAKDLGQVVSFLNGAMQLDPFKINISEEFLKQVHNYETDFADVKGQEAVKRALMVAASGNHNIILIGPPGAGKTMLARRLPSIIPPMNLEEALETTKIHSVAGRMGQNGSLITLRPFRSPHHTISDVALVGGGVYPQPGEISLAHNGVLFLDELPEFKRHVLEVMRQPMEERIVTISRSKFSIDYPSNFMLVASMNPCPCGFYNHPEKSCSCGAGIVKKYLGKVSGPLLDRIDLHVEVVPVPFKQLSELREAEKSAAIREQVIAARAIQEKRFSGYAGIYCNAQMNSHLLRRYCLLDNSGQAILKTAMDRLGLSARAYDRILKVARTIADLDECDVIRSAHVAEAVNYRSLDREGWAG
jgi:magnesium chelatase family protein